MNTKACKPTIRMWKIDQTEPAMIWAIGSMMPDADAAKALPISAINMNTYSPAYILPNSRMP